MYRSNVHNHNVPMIGCHLDSSSPSDDDKKPTLDSDWRSFRARLVALEKVSKPETLHLPPILIQ